MGERDRRMGERDRRVLRLGGKRAGWRQPEGEREGMSVMNAWGFLHWSIISLCFSRFFFYVDRLALCLVLWFMLGCYLLHFSMGCMFDLTHPHLNPLIQTCNMAGMGSFYPFPLCSICYFPMFSMPCHGEYHSSPFCRRFYTGEHPQSRPQVQPVLVLAGAGAG